MTDEVERMLDNEAYRRARGYKRIPTKILSRETGFSCGYVANIISGRRRAHEKKIHITIERVGFVKNEASRGNRQ